MARPLLPALRGEGGPKGRMRGGANFAVGGAAPCAFCTKRRAAPHPSSLRADTFSPQSGEKGRYAE